mgnify:CR=1 FL=1
MSWLLSGPPDHWRIAFLCSLPSLVLPEPLLYTLLGGLIGFISSLSTFIFNDWYQAKKRREATIQALLSELRGNYEILKTLLGESDYLPDHWSYRTISLNQACFENARQSGYLYALKPELYQKISKAYVIIRLISQEHYGPDGTAQRTFMDLKEILEQVLNIIDSETSPCAP